MSIVHSYAVGNGDMFSIRHNSDNCTIIDCSILEDNKDWLLGKSTNSKRTRELFASFPRTRTRII